MGLGGMCFQVSLVRSAYTFMGEPGPASGEPGPTSDLLQRLPESINVMSSHGDACVGHAQSGQPLSVVWVSPCNLLDDHFCSSKGIMTHAGDLWNGMVSFSDEPKCKPKGLGQEQVWTKAELGGGSF